MDDKLANKIISNFCKLCAIKFTEECKTLVINHLKYNSDITETTELSKRQFNEILLLCNETRVSQDFFDYLINGAYGLKISKFNESINRFRIHSMLQYGNFRYAFKELISSKEIDKKLSKWLREPNILIKEFKTRPAPIIDLQKIPRNKIHKLGYLTDEESDKEVYQKAKYNANVYLTSDYLDVYVATSMRHEFDYQSVFDLCDGVFNNPKINNLNLRYFDPTQSFHSNRIAKGLIEGLMLKRAKCTIYSSQESDSFGKDSELAATLAQGKPVIAFIPKIDPNDKKHHEELSRLPLELILDKAETIEKSVCDEDWDEYTNLYKEIVTMFENKVPETRIRETLNTEVDKFIIIIAKAEYNFYEKRAKILQDYHPLGFQVHLDSGVANGVLIARTHNECADLLYDILTNQLEFDILKPSETIDDNEDYKPDKLNYLLIEKKSGCAFRVVTTDKMLTNSFWNFYLK